MLRPWTYLSESQRPSLSISLGSTLGTKCCMYLSRSSPEKKNPPRVITIKILGKVLESQKEWELDKMSVEEKGRWSKLSE